MNGESNAMAEASTKLRGVNLGSWLVLQDNRACRGDLACHIKQVFYRDGQTSEWALKGARVGCRGNEAFRGDLQESMQASGALGVSQAGLRCF